MKRSPHLVPYSKVDDAIKKANRYVLNCSCGICVFCVCSMAVAHCILILSLTSHMKRPERNHHYSESLNFDCNLSHLTLMPQHSTIVDVCELP